MGSSLRRRLSNLSLAQRFILGSLLILIAGMALIGFWVEQQITNGVVQRTATTTALYVDSFITPHLQDLAAGDTLSLEHRQTLDRLLRETALGQRIATFKVWS